MAGDPPPPDSSTRWVETTRGIVRYSELAPLIAERVLRVQQRVEAGEFSQHPLDESFLCELHCAICGDLVAWAGRWRDRDVRVGAHEPPPAHLVHAEMRNYTLDLAARLGGGIDLDLLPEHLAFAEGRLLSVHPFLDFNGRTARVWLWEILRRLDLPPVELAPTAPAAAAAFIAALRAADQRDYRPLADLWRARLAAGAADHV